MKYSKHDVIQGSVDWYDLRYGFVTASRVAALVGICPYRTAFQYATEILTRQEPDNDGKEFLFARGHAVEQAAREWVRAQLGLEMTPAVVSSNEIQLLASLDGMFEEKRLGFEAKYLGRDALKDVKAGKIKPHHTIQLQAQLLVTGFDKFIYFAVDPDGHAAILDVLPDAKMQAQIAEKVREFWSMIKEGRLPEPGPRDILTVEDDPQMAMLAELDAKVKAAEKEFDAVKTQVLKRYAGKPRVQGNGVSITTAWTQGSVDWKALATALIAPPEEEQARFKRAGKFVTTVKCKKGA